MTELTFASNVTLDADGLSIAGERFPFHIRPDVVVTEYSRGTVAVTFSVYADEFVQVEPIPEHANVVISTPPRRGGRPMLRITVSTFSNWTAGRVRYSDRSWAVWVGLGRLRIRLER